MCYATRDQPSFVVVDAWIDTVPGGLPVKDTQKARGAVAPWKSYAADTNAAVLLVAHTNRGDRDNLRNTYGLSVALRQVARSTLYAAEDHDTSALLVGPDKSNLGAGAMAERFERTPVQHFPSTDQNDGTVPRLDYLGTDGRTITDALADQLRDKQPERKTDAIDKWLRAALGSGAVRSTDLEERAKEQGYTPSQLHRSRTRVKARAFKVGERMVHGTMTTPSEGNIARSQDHGSQTYRARLQSCTAKGNHEDTKPQRPQLRTGHHAPTQRWRDHHSRPRLRAYWPRRTSTRDGRHATAHPGGLNPQRPLHHSTQTVYTLRCGVAACVPPESKPESPTRRKK